MFHPPRGMSSEEFPPEFDELPDGWVRVRQGGLVGVGRTRLQACIDLKQKEYALPEWVHRLAAGDVSALPENLPKPPDERE